MADQTDAQEGVLERWGDDLERSRLGRDAARLVPFGGTVSREMEQIAEDLGEEARRDQQMLQQIGEAFQQQPPAEMAGVDLAAVRAVDPQFDDTAFRTIARETFNRVREARSTERVGEADALLSPTMEAELQQEVSGDVAAHRHHLLPGLEVEDATIIGAAVINGREVLDVRLTLEGEELERDDATTAIVSGDALVRRWSERWRFERDPAVDSSRTDFQHSMAFHDGWLVAHRGWVVTQIERLPEPATVTPQQVAPAPPR